MRRCEAPANGMAHVKLFCVSGTAPVQRNSGTTLRAASVHFASRCRTIGAHGLAMCAVHHSPVTHEYPEQGCCEQLPEGSSAALHRVSSTRSPSLCKNKRETQCDRPWDTRSSVG